MIQLGGCIIQYSHRVWNTQETRVGLIQVCLNETCSTLCIGKYQTDKFPIQNGL
jgi:hypothetical protein